MDNTKLPAYEDIEKDAMKYADSQEQKNWSVAKIAYIAGAQDYLVNPATPTQDNLLSPAYPLTASLDESENKYFTVADVDLKASGFTKIELASLMIAQGIASHAESIHYKSTASSAVLLAKAVLEEANK